jgi:hypothetical protein
VVADSGHAGWEVIGCSVRGAAHERSGLPNQDAVGWTRWNGAGAGVAVAVSDGHGSAKSFRSDVGSTLAVDAALSALRELAEASSDEMAHSARKRLAEDALPRTLVRRWCEAVEAHLAEHPFGAEELDRLVAAQGGGAREAVERNPRLAYGATLLAVLLGDVCTIYLQLGDGDMLAVASDGSVTRPVAGDTRLFANETTSLASEDAWRDTRTTYQPLVAAPPALIVLATDGYSNSFRTDDDFLQVGTDYLELLREEGPESVSKSLPDWLAAVTTEGSGDDVSAVLAYRLETT